MNNILLNIFHLNKISMFIYLIYIYKINKYNIRKKYVFLYFYRNTHFKENKFEYKFKKICKSL